MFGMEVHQIIIKRVLVAVAVAFGLRFNFNPWLTGGNGPECAPPVLVFSAVHGNTTAHEGDGHVQALVVLRGIIPVKFSRLRKNSP
jgi:hypothetical protein